jgi:hypothetical protein
MLPHHFPHPGRYSPRAALALAVLLLLSAAACKAQAGLFATPSPIARTQVRAAPTSTPTPKPPAAPTRRVLVLSPVPQAARAGACAYAPATAALLQGTSSAQWLDWIEKLSGAQPVTIAGVETTITTRYSPALFNGNPRARAFDFVLQTIQGWYPPEQIAVMEYMAEDDEGEQAIWKNLVLTLPGSASPDELVILSAHLDSISDDDPDQLAPGAEDNASGAAALLEAARLLREQRFARTLQIVWFTGEEQGMLGSHAFVRNLSAPDNVVGVVNLDMFGFDTDGDRCFELHTGELPESQVIAQCFASSIDAYGLDLPRYDLLIEDAINQSDHGQFWDAGIGAVEVLEDMEDQELPGGCPASDPNPQYHTPDDTVDLLNPQSGIALVRAALATIIGLAE